MMIKQHINDYLFYCEVECRFSKHTIDAYRGDLGLYTIFLGCASMSEGFQVERLKAYLAYMIKDQSLSVATARRRIASLRGFCRFLDEQGVIDDPFRVWSPTLRRPKRLPRALSRKVVRKLVKSKQEATQIESETVFCLLLLGATGIRVSELCAIRLRDVAPDGSSICIAGKGAKERIVYIGNRDLSRQISERRKIRATFAGLDLSLFMNSRNAPLKPQTLRRRLHRIAADRGLSEPVTPHNFRHSAATMLLENGADIRFVQRQLGHASISTTELYTHVTDTALKRAISKADPIAGLT